MFAADKLLALEAPWWGYVAFSLAVMTAMELLAVLVPYIGRSWLRLQVSSTNPLLPLRQMSDMMLLM